MASESKKIMVSWPKMYATFENLHTRGRSLPHPRAGSNFLAPRSCENMQFILLWEAQPNSSSPECAPRKKLEKIYGTQNWRKKKRIENFY